MKYNFFNNYRRLLLSVICLPVSFLQSMQINEANMRQASHELTEKESLSIKKYLQDRIDTAKNIAETDQNNKESAMLETIVNEFYRGRYDLVIQGMYTLGYNPQEILGTTALRTSMLAGKLEQTPWFLREIAGLDWFFERDSKRSRKHKQWPLLQDKMTYLLSLADQLERNHMRIIDKSMIRDALDSLIMRITLLNPKLPESMQLKAQEVLARLEALRAVRNIEKAGL